MDATRSERARHLEQIQAFLRSRNIPSRTLNKVVSYYQYLWLCGDGSGVEKLMRDIPRTLKAEIDLYLKRRLIESVPFFRTCSVAEILTVVQSLRPRIMMPKDYIIRQGDAGDEMYFIVRGSANVVVSKPGQPDIVVVTLRQGMFFGESALMEGEIAVRNASVRSEGFSELMSLSRADFREMTIQFPHFKEFVQKLARERARAKKEKDDKEREKSGGGRGGRGALSRRDSRMHMMRRSISSIRTGPSSGHRGSIDNSASSAGEGSGTDAEGASPTDGPRRLGRFSQGLRQASFSARNSITGGLGLKRNSLSVEPAIAEDAGPKDDQGTTENLINRMHNRGNLSRGLSRKASMGDRQSSTASRASAGSGGKGDGETASLKIEEADGSDDDNADRGPTNTNGEPPSPPVVQPSRAPPKRGNMRANSINIISSGMDRLGLASKSRAGQGGQRGSLTGGLLRRSPSVENGNAGSIFDEVARSLEDVTQNPAVSPNGTRRFSAESTVDRATAAPNGARRFSAEDMVDRASAERTRSSIDEAEDVDEDGDGGHGDAESKGEPGETPPTAVDDAAPAPAPAPAPGAVDLDAAEKDLLSIDA